MKKNTFRILTLGVASLLLVNCGGDKKATAEKQEAAQTETANKKVTPKPADLHIYKASEVMSQMNNTFANVGFEAGVTDTPEEMMIGNKALQALYFDHKMGTIQRASFKNCQNLKEVHFDDVVALIFDEAFMGCTSLKEYKATTGAIGVQAFDGCTSLETVNMGEVDQSRIYTEAFANCTSLKTVILPMVIGEIEDGAFKGCKAIESLAVPYNFNDRMYTFVAEAKGIKNLYILSLDAYKFPTTAAAKAFNKKQCTAYVPDELLEAFKADATWADFAAIKPLSESGYYNADCSIK